MSMREVDTFYKQVIIVHLPVPIVHSALTVLTCTKYVFCIINIFVLLLILRYRSTLGHGLSVHLLAPIGMDLSASSWAVLLSLDSSLMKCVVNWTQLFPKYSITYTCLTDTHVYIHVHVHELIHLDNTIMYIHAYMLNSICLLLHVSYSLKCLPPLFLCYPTF